MIIRANPQPFQHFHTLVFPGVRGGLFRRSDKRRKKDCSQRIPKRRCRNKASLHATTTKKSANDVIATSLNDVEAQNPVYNNNKNNNNNSPSSFIHRVNLYCSF